MKKVISVVLFLGLLLSLAYVVFPYFALKNQQIDQKVIQTIEESIGGKFTYTDFHVSYFPYLEVHFSKPVYLSPQAENLQLQADSLDIQIARWSFFLGRPRISALDLKHGTLAFALPKIFDVDPISLQNVLLHIGAVRPGKPIEIELTGSSKEVQNILEMVGTLHFSSLEDWKWKDVGFDLDVGVKPVAFKSFERLMQNLLKVETMRGDLGGSFKATKTTGSDWVEVKGKAEARDIAYSLKTHLGVESPLFDAPIQFYFQWNAQTEILRTHKFHIQTPVGILDFRGQILWATRELQESRLLFSKVVLENIPQYFIRLKDLIPLNIGFSGQSELELSLSGVWDHLSIDANWNLTHALLTYARYFSKPKEVPFNMTFDFLLKEGRTVSGDFSTHLNDAVGKGTVTDLNLRDLSGQINLITNKFSLKGWENFLPPFSDYKVGGDVKVLANLKGDFHNLQKAETTMNISVDNGSIDFSDVHSMSEIKLMMDIAPGVVEVKKFTAMIDKSDLTSNLTVYGSGVDKSVNLNVNSKNLELFHAYEVLAVFAQSWLTEAQKRYVEKIGIMIPELSPDRQVLENFFLDLKHRDKVWSMKKMSFDAYGGNFEFDGELEKADYLKKYTLNLSTKKVSLAQYMKRGGNELNLIAGNMFLNLAATGSYDENQNWIDQMQGSGSILITNGEIYAFDIVDTLAEFSSQIQPLTPNEVRSPLHDLRADFSILNKKFTTQNLTLIYEDYNVDARGDFSFDGHLNFGLEAYLAPSRVGIEVTQNESQRLIRPIGPFSMFVSGPFREAELRADPSVNPQSIANKITESRQSGFNNFLTEEQFFYGSTP